MAPRVAVLMPVYNGARFIAAAIESVLAQTYADFELLVIIDGSTDRSREIAESFGDPRIRIVDNTTRTGLPASLNRAMQLTTTEYIARLDADDIAFPERLAIQVAWLDAHPGVAILGTQALPVDEKGRVIRRLDWWYRHWPAPVGGAALDWYRIFYTPFTHSSVMFRRAVIMALGGYDTGCGLGEDTELWMRVARRHEIANLSTRLVAHRKHSTSMSVNTDLRGEYARLRRSIVHAVMKDVLQTDAPERWSQLWVSISHGEPLSPRTDTRDLLDILDAIEARLAELHPSDTRSIATQHAALIARVAVRLAATHRDASLIAFRRLAERNRRIALRTLPHLLPKMLAGRQLWTRLNRR